jgi:hypothetical protein
MEKIFKFVAYLGAAAIVIASAPVAKAGCGRVVLPGLLSPESTEARTAGTGQSVEPRPANDDAAGYQAIVGLWISTVLSGGQPIYQAFESFTSDGLEVLNDNGAPQAGNVCLGVWAPTGKNALKVNHPSWNYDNNGNVIGTVIIKSQITIDPGGNSYKGTVTVDTYDLNGKKVPGGSFSGQLTAKRITAN